MWIFSNGSEQRRLERAFSNRRIDFSSPAFQDSANFLEEERRNPRFLETYARYVEVRAYSPFELTDARCKISLVAEAVRAAVATDGRTGLCVNASGVIGRMLDQLGVWNYVAKASMTIMFSPAVESEPLYFWAIDEGEFYAPHAIVVAPPFGIIDVTVKHQIYDDPEQINALPGMVLAEEFSIASWSPDDIANDDIRAYLSAKRIPFNTYLKHERPNMLEVMGMLPPRSVRCGNAELKYVIVAVGGIIEPLTELHTNLSLGGRTPQQIFEEDVLSRMQAEI
jgi:hypothetical protein